MTGEWKVWRELTGMFGACLCQNGCGLCQNGCGALAAEDRGIGCAMTRLHLLSAMAIAAWWRLFKILVAVFHVLVMGRGSWDDVAPGTGSSSPPLGWANDWFIIPRISGLIAALRRPPVLIPSGRTTILWLGYELCWCCSFLLLLHRLFAEDCRLFQRLWGSVCVGGWPWVHQT
jgi:hypothetical protein